MAIAQTTACLFAVACSELLGVSHSLLVSLSTPTLVFCALTLLPLGIAPVLCTYFGSQPGQEPTAFELKRQRPFVWRLVGIALALVVGGGTFGVGLYFAGVGAQHLPSATECGTARIIDVQQYNYQKFWRCRRWARVMLSTGESVLPFVDAAEWSEDLPNSMSTRDVAVLVLINRNALGSSVAKVLPIRQGAGRPNCSFPP